MEKHKNASNLTSDPSISEIDGPQFLAAPEPPPVEMLLDQYFAAVECELHPPSNNLALDYDPFTEVIMADEGYYIDTDSHQVKLFAGVLSTNSNEMHIIKQLEDLQNGGHVELESAPLAIDTLESDSDIDATVPDVIAALQAMGLDDFDLDETDDIDEIFYTNLPQDHDWDPYESKTMFMLDLSDNLPRLRLSDDQLKMILWIMRECGTPNVPSFAALRKKQIGLARNMSIKTVMSPVAFWAPNRDFRSFLIPQPTTLRLFYSL
ncbi:hypothetical protein AcV7_003988 [Taiwanofungus camphoratus]|nr:hypothetical protein AcV7_003988 [Antrodia cinnamomea]